MLNWRRTKDDAMADDSPTIDLSRAELREVAGYAVACARSALAIFERERAEDRRPHAAIDAAQAFVDGGERSKALRDSAWAAHRAAQEACDAGQAAASDAARAAGHAAGAAFLHPLPRATQVKHILGSAAHAARAFELFTGEDPAVGLEHRSPGSCASRRSGRLEALPERAVWWWTCRGTDSNARRIAATTGDRPITERLAKRPAK
jgi:hypothetical protein